MNKNIIIKFIIVYFLITSVFSFVFIEDYRKTINNHLNETTQNQYLKFKSIYNRYKTIASLIFDTDINRPEIINIFKNAHNSNKLEKNIIRELLFSKLSSQYTKLKTYNLRQLHFHLPNNESFLRMHRPKKFGDNLTGIRHTVMYVNEHKKYYHGFEEGRIFNGFRFVYPLFWEEEHIGSVEISFSALALIEAFHNTFNINSNFIIRKSVVDKKVFDDEKKNYIQSPQKEFYFEKNVYERFPPISITNDSKDYTNETIKGEPFTIYVEELNLIKTIIPIKNKLTNDVNAAICVCVEDFFISNAQKALIALLIFTYISIFIILFLFYKQKKTNNDLDKRIEMEIEKSRKKDLQIQNQSKLLAISNMLNNLAHQWRQPLNVISTSASGLKIHSEVGSLDDKTFELLTNSILDKTQYLSKTIESFKEYFNINKNEDKEIYSIQKIIDNSLDILSSNFEYNTIKVVRDYKKKELLIKTSKAELIQAIIHILNNSKDALIKNNSYDNRKVNIKIKQENDFAKITIEDNAGGIPKEIITQIFEPYFTTKHKSQGTGISLYFVYETISVSLDGEIYVENTSSGAKFNIKLPLCEKS